MLTVLLATLFTMVAVGSLLSLSDSAIKWRNAYRALKAEMAVQHVENVPVESGAVIVLQNANAVSSRSCWQAAPDSLAIAA